MQKTTIATVILVLCIAAMPVMAQTDEAEEKTYTHVPFSLSFIPNISVGGLMGGDIITNCSINIIGGRVAKLNGIEFGSVLNWETEEVRGAQFSGVINFLERGNLKGLQAAGVVNYVGGSAIGGAQLGTINYVAGDIKGLQAGTINYVGHDIKGLQLGTINYAAGDVTGAQIGTVNYSGAAFDGIQLGTVNYINMIGGQVNRGAQIGVVNIGGNISGAQIGVVNIARKVEGTQIGVVNYADEHNGAPIGLFSFVRKGQIHLDVWASETSVFNMALKTGSKHVYSILALGYQPSIGDDPHRWSPGVGIGVHIPSGSKYVNYVNIEALSFHINEDESWTDELHMLNQLRLIGGWELNHNMSAFAGLTLNVFVSQLNDGDHISVASFFDYDGNDTWVRMWPGVVAGVRF